MRLECGCSHWSSLLTHSVGCAGAVWSLRCSLGYLECVAHHRLSPPARAYRLTMPRALGTMSSVKHLQLGMLPRKTRPVAQHPRCRLRQKSTRRNECLRHKQSRPSSRQRSSRTIALGCCVLLDLPCTASTTIGTVVKGSICGGCCVLGLPR